MKDNPNFETPNVTMVFLAALIDSYEQSVVDASTGTKTKVAIKITLRKELVAVLKKLAQYVNSVCDGSLDKLASSGFTLAKAPQPRVLGTPINLQLSQGINPGDIISRLPKVKGANSYTHMYTEHPLTKDSVWTSGAAGTLTQVFEGLQQGKMYWFRVCANGSRAQKAYSEEVLQSVLVRSISIG